MHFQRAPQNWPDVLPHLPPRALLKAFDPSLLRDAKRLRPDLITCYRHFDLDYFFSDDLAACVEAWRANFARFIDRTYLEQYAPYVDLIETLNEHTDSRMVTDPDLLRPHLMTEAAALDVWHSTYRGRTVTSQDGGQGAIPAQCRLVICNSPVGNDVPREFYRLAAENDAVLGIHPYTRYWRGVRDPWDWIYHSGRWAYNEAQYGIRPVYAFTECGPYAGSAEGWRHPDVLNGDVAALAEAMRAWSHDVTQTAAYREGRVLGPGAWFTSGHVGWEWYQMDTPELIAVADAIRTEWVAPVPVPVKARGLDVSYPQDPAAMRYAEWRALGICYGYYSVAIGLSRIANAGAHRAAMRAAGYLTGPYQALHEDAAPDMQAALLLSLRGPDDELPSMLDAERAGVTEPMLRLWCDYYDAHTTRDLVIYTGKPWWESHVPVAARARYAKYDLMIAAYPYDSAGAQPMDPVSVALRSTPPDDRTPALPGPWREFWAWQHTGHGSLPGYDKFLDLEVHCLTEPELRARYGHKEIDMLPADLEAIHTHALAIDAIAQKYLAPPPPPAPVPLFRVKVVAASLNIRSTPGVITTATDIGDALKDQVFDVWEVVRPTGYTYDWYRIDPAQQRWIAGGSYVVRV